MPVSVPSCIFTKVSTVDVFLFFCCGPSMVAALTIVLESNSDSVGSSMLVLSSMRLEL